LKLQKIFFHRRDLFRSRWCSHWAKMLVRGESLRDWCFVQWIRIL
jgi:hypothetical protein